MNVSKKTKVDSECHGFNQEWMEYQFKGSMSDMPREYCSFQGTRQETFFNQACHKFVRKSPEIFSQLHSHAEYFHKAVNDPRICYMLSHELTEKREPLSDGQF